MREDGEKHGRPCPVETIRDLGENQTDETSVQDEVRDCSNVDEHGLSELAHVSLLLIKTLPGDHVVEPRPFTTFATRPSLLSSHAYVPCLSHTYPGAPCIHECVHVYYCLASKRYSNF